MSEHITVVDTSEIREGRLDDLRAAVAELARFVEENEPRPIAYNVYFDDAGRHMTVVQVHPDAASMELHMEIGGPAFGRFADLLTLRTMDVYGEPTETLLAQIRRKVDLLGEATATIHRREAGFARFDRVTPSTGSSLAT